ncbi:MAG TPA: NAD(+) synthase, partial [Usitatibacter sp.]|nr:NAD(+) synthase [Usitatibacter sp.]
MSPFFSIHRQGMVRVASCTPRIHVGDPLGNCAETLAMMRAGEARHADLMLFPELGLSAYAIDDLLLQDALLDGVEEAIRKLVQASRDMRHVCIVGAPIRRNQRLYNCGVVIARGRIVGVVPKSFLPNYREFYESRWFSPGVGLRGLEVEIAGETVPFGVDLLFAASGFPDFTFHVEICEDFWTATPPSSQGALAGALVLCNLSASNVVIGKAEARATLCASQAMRCHAAYVYSASGPGESTTDLAWDGQATIHEMGDLLAETERFPRESQMAVADVDLERLRQERMRTVSFSAAAAEAGDPENCFRRIGFEFEPSTEDVGLERRIDRFPFVPDDPARLDKDCYEAFNIQVQGLMKRMQVTNGERIVIGVSGGLDSTHALLVAAKAFDALGLPRSNILGFTMPGFATSEGTKSNAWKLMRALKVSGEEIDIRPVARKMLEDLGHPYAKGEPVYDITFENVQAGLRTDYLFRLANQRHAFVLGTGDLSELALGWCTYGVGDHMSHYNVNGSVSKTLIQYLVRWVITSGQLEPGATATLQAILDTKISPELVPGSELQGTEAKVGPYELQDFNLYYV